MRSLVLALCAFAAAPAPSAAEGDPTWRAVRLDPLLIDADHGFSIWSYDLETGVYYRWRVVSDGLEEYRLLAPELFRESWIDQVVIEDREIRPYGLGAIEFDGEGEVDVWFVPIRPGTYGFRVVGLESEGFSGAFVVR